MKRITTNDPETHSADVVAQNLKHLKMLFPDAFTEGKGTLRCSNSFSAPR